MNSNFSKLIISTAVVSTMLLSFTANVVYASDSKPFSDVGTSNENYQAIQYMKTIGVVEGYSDGRYKPSNFINRAEFLKILMMTADLDVTGFDFCFPDVTDQWYAPYVCFAKDRGYVHGYPDGYFRPEQSINFAEASKIVSQVLSVTVNADHSDPWYYMWVEGLENVYAIPTSIASFTKLVSRGEMAEITWRIKVHKITKPTNTYQGLLDGTVQQKQYGNGKVSGVTSITLTDEKNGNVKWTVQGEKSEMGYELLWSKYPNPAYPANESQRYEYYGDPEDSSGSIDTFDGNGTYYVRVCESLDGLCGVYSNEIEVEL